MAWKGKDTREETDFRLMPGKPETLDISDLT